jgi:hypothetical protein
MNNESSSGPHLSVLSLKMNKSTLAKNKILCAILGHVPQGLEEYDGQMLEKLCAEFECNT